MNETRYRNDVNVIVTSMIQEGAFRGLIRPILIPIQLIRGATREDYRDYNPPKGL